MLKVRWVTNKIYVNVWRSVYWLSAFTPQGNFFEFRSLWLNCAPSISWLRKFRIRILPKEVWICCEKGPLLFSEQVLFEKSSGFYWLFEFCFPFLEIFLIKWWWIVNEACLACSSFLILIDIYESFIRPQSGHVTHVLEVTIFPG